MKPQNSPVAGATVELHALECGGAYGVPFVCVCDDEARAIPALLDPDLTNTERRIIRENPDSDPAELLATLEGYETT